MSLFDWGFRDPYEDWMDDSKCGNDRELLEWQRRNRDDQFFDENLENTKGMSNYEKVSLRKDKISRAGRYCQDCPVRKACLDYALREEPVGIWAGTTERQRKSMKKKAQKKALEFLQRIQGKAS